MIIRPAKTSDLDALLALAHESGPGMTNFNANADSMIKKLNHTKASFAAKLEQPNDEYYFFVLEDPATNKIAGCCGIYSSVGVHRPFYSFRVLNLTHTSQEVKFYEPVQVLQMVEEHRGCAEIVSLFLSPDYRKDGNGKLLSRSRFLFIAEFINRFPEYMIAEMRGKVNQANQSAFWNNLGGHFFPMDFIEADQFNALGHFQFIADMMPKYPIYIRLLPEDAQAMIGRTHDQTVPALKMLEHEGFRTDGCVDIFDAGPIIKCPIDQIKTVCQSFSATVQSVEPISQGQQFMICNTQLAEFRLGRGKLQIHDDQQVSIEPELAQLLNLNPGDQLRYIQF